MSLPPAAPQRQLKHRRQIDVPVVARGHGVWEVDALLTDTKTRIAQMAEGPRSAGKPIHDLLLRLVVNEQLDALGPAAKVARCPTRASAVTMATPMALAAPSKSIAARRCGPTARPSACTTRAGTRPYPLQQPSRLTEPHP